MNSIKISSALLWPLNQRQSKVDPVLPSDRNQPATNPQFVSRGLVQRRRQNTSWVGPEFVITLSARSKWRRSVVGWSVAPPASAELDV
jgi:hypothetical protein